MHKYDIKTIKLDFPPIAPILVESQSPLWSVMIPTYNSDNYLQQALKSVLDQDPGVKKMQIEVIDDCSKNNNAKDITYSVGQGRILFSRNSRNLGFVENWNTCIRRAKGSWVHILHQDDLVLPGFYDHLESLIKTYPNISAAFTRYAYVDHEDHWLGLSEIEQREPGILEEWVSRIASFQRVRCPAIVVKRSTYEQLGGYCQIAGFAADWEMWKRIAVHGSFGYHPAILACYRIHPGSETSRIQGDVMDMRDVCKSIDISETYLPSKSSKKLSRMARQMFALAVLRQANDLMYKHRVKDAYRRALQALSCSFSKATVIAGLVFLIFSVQVLIQSVLSKLK